MAYNVKYDPSAIIANAIKQQNDYAQKNYGYQPYTQTPVATQQPVNVNSGGGGGGGGNPVTTTSAASNLATILQNAYKDSLAANQLQYDNSVKAMQSAYDRSATKVNDAAKNALREAYINRMQTQRTMPQQLAALGIHGGMAETTAARLNNNYADNRNAIEASRMGELGDLSETLLQNIYGAANNLASQNAAVQQSYYQQLAEQAIADATPAAASYDYRTDPAYIAQLAGVYSGDTDVDTIKAYFQELANKYGLAGANALLAAAAK
jgi:hypothetical protein